MKIAVIGSGGQLGKELLEYFSERNWDTEPLDLDRIDVADRMQVNLVLKETGADVVVNTAAMHHVEKCEADPDTAFRVNASGALNLALASVENDFYLVHVSTDYVFDGSKKEPYVESDCPAPLNVYGVSKAAGEMLITANCRRFAVVRACGLYGKHPCLAKGGLNFVELMLKLSREREEVRVVDDEILTPTSTLEVSRQIFDICSKQPPPGIYHATAQGECSWYEFAREIFTLTGAGVRLNKAAPGEFPAKVARPNYSVLENAALKQAGMDILKDWRQGLREYLALQNYI